MGWRIKEGLSEDVIFDLSPGLTSPCLGHPVNSICCVHPRGHKSLFLQTLGCLLPPSSPLQWKPPAFSPSPHSPLLEKQP